jgi:hypothetical protein
VRNGEFEVIVRLCGDFERRYPVERRVQADRSTAGLLQAKLLVGSV